MISEKQPELESKETKKDARVSRKSNVIVGSKVS